MQKYWVIDSDANVGGFQLFFALFVLLVLPNGSIMPNPECSFRNAGNFGNLGILTLPLQTCPHLTMWNVTLVKVSGGFSCWRHQPNRVGLVLWRFNVLPLFLCGVPTCTHPFSPPLISTHKKYNWHHLMLISCHQKKTSVITLWMRHSQKSNDVALPAYTTVPRSYNITNLPRVSIQG